MFGININITSIDKASVSANRSDARECGEAETAPIG